MSEDSPSLSDARLAANKAALVARPIQKREIERERESLHVTQKISAQIPISVIDLQLDQQIRLLLAAPKTATDDNEAHEAPHRNDKDRACTRSRDAACCALWSATREGPW